MRNLVRQAVIGTLSVTSINHISTMAGAPPCLFVDKVKRLIEFEAFFYSGEHLFVPLDT